MPLDELELLSPITHPCRVIAQATNYGAHVREVGLDPAARSSNVLFRKSSAASAGPTDAIVRPAHVRLLDYEIELGLVIGAPARSQTAMNLRSQCA
ncbi:MAG TPA: fumarylacetoacetate hydrolase family protein [Polyangiales bacterium]